MRHPERVRRAPVGADVGSAQALVADAEYWHDQLDVAKLEQEGPESIIATASLLQAAHDAQTAD